MLSLVSIVLTFLALIFIPSCLFLISRCLSVPVSFKNILRFVKVAGFYYNNEEMKRDDATGEIEKKGKMPNHVAIILDGNRRWAKKKGLGTSDGHIAGGKRVGELTSNLFALGINTVSLFAFSTENWGRPQDEVDYLMELFEENMKLGIPYFQRNEIKVSVIGNRARISKTLLGLIQEVEEATKSFKEKHLIMAIDYSGRFDILQACKSLAKKAKNGEIKVEDIDEKLMDTELMTKCSKFSNPDLLIRTSGEQRVSNFFLWQLEYTELYFPNVLWPDFGKTHFIEALTWYQQRNKRFGRRF